MSAATENNAQKHNSIEWNYFCKKFRYVIYYDFIHCSGAIFFHSELTKSIKGSRFSNVFLLVLFFITTRIFQWATRRQT